MAGSYTRATIPNAVIMAAGTPTTRILMAYVAQVLASLNYSEYDDVNVWDDAARRYFVLCNQFVNHVVEAASSIGFDVVQGFANSKSVSAVGWYDLLASLPSPGRDRWLRVERPSLLLPGDVFAIRYSPGSGGAKGHVGIVAAPPVAERRWPSSFAVKVADSSASRHGPGDTRLDGTGGLGVGDMLFREDPSTGKFNGWAWSSYGNWRIDGAAAFGRLE
jgi:hypothetical protein